ncbi:MAG: PxKF domain-containing protein [Verrucomicrobiales bacterium]|nr:PxKF domain-containing protein [Verrucomicrobiales bacterium]
MPEIQSSLPVPGLTDQERDGRCRTLTGAESLRPRRGGLALTGPEGTSIFAGLSADITDLGATLSYMMINAGVPGPVNEASSTSAATTGNLFRYDLETGDYIYNWNTKGLSAGLYELQLDLGDGLTRTVTVGLR